MFEVLYFTSFVFRLITFLIIGLLYGYGLKQRSKASGLKQRYSKKKGLLSTLYIFFESNLILYEVQFGVLALAGYAYF